MTTEQANQLSSLYNQLIKYEGDKVLLWTNSSLSSEFAAQTISVDLSSYRYAIVLRLYSIYDSDKSDESMSMTFILIPIGSTRVLHDGNIYRTAKVQSSSIVFSSASVGSSTDNKYCIPAKIYGI